MFSLSKNITGLVVGLFFGLVHLAWALLVALGWAKPIMDWIFHLHFLEFAYTVPDFRISTAVWLVVATFVIGYIFGWVFAAVWNMLHKRA